MKGGHSPNGTKMNIREISPEVTKALYVVFNMVEMRSFLTNTTTQQNVRFYKECYNNPKNEVEQKRGIAFFNAAAVLFNNCILDSSTNFYQTYWSNNSREIFKEIVHEFEF